MSSLAWSAAGPVVAVEAKRLAADHELVAVAERRRDSTMRSSLRNVPLRLSQVFDEEAGRSRGGWRRGGG